MRSIRRASLRTALLAAAGAALAPAALAATATAAPVIAYECDPGGDASGICAISPYGGTPRTLVKLAGGPLLGSPSVSPDGTTFATSFPHHDANGPTRLVAGSTSLSSPVTSYSDTTRVHDLRPPITTTNIYYGGAQFVTGTTTYLYGTYNAATYASSTKLRTGSTEVAIPGSTIGTFGGKPFYFKGSGTSRVNCQYVSSAQPCRSIAPGKDIAVGSHNGKYIVTREPAVKQNPWDFGNINLAVRDATTLKVLRTFARADAASFSPTDKSIAFSTSIDPDGYGDQHIKVAATTGTATPHDLGRGKNPSWGGS